jgi:hypothetical protein
VSYAQYDIAYKGDMYNNLSSVTGNGFPRFLQPPYDIMNLRIGINPPSGRRLTEFYITNLANKNAIIFTNTGNYDVRQTTTSRVCSAYGSTTVSARPPAAARSKRQRADAAVNAPGRRCRSCLARPGGNGGR